MPPPLESRRSAWHSLWVRDTPAGCAGCQTLPQPSEMSKKKIRSRDLPLEQAELCAEQAPNMKRPLFLDGFLINAHHSHPSASQEEPPPSFLSSHARPLLLSPAHISNPHHLPRILYRNASHTLAPLHPSPSRVGTVSLAPPLLTDPTPSAPAVWPAQVS